MTPPPPTRTPRPTITPTIGVTLTTVHFFPSTVVGSLTPVPTLTTIAADKNSTIVFPLPIDLLAHLTARRASGDLPVVT